MGDIVATIQAEQDEIIRSPQAGVLIVQGGPGTGKTVVALHRAAYLLYTYRFPLEDQGVLVIGPNRVFLRYIERVLPSLGEAGVEQVVLADLVPDVRWAGPGDPGDTALAARVKGDARMSDVIDKAVRDRERPLRQELRVPFRTGYVRLSAGDSARIVKAARRRFRRHNAGRRFVEAEVFAALASSWRGEPAVTSGDVRSALRTHPDVRAALERMWPVLDAGPAAPRPVRLRGAAAVGRRRRLRPTTSWPRSTGRGPNTSTTSGGRRRTWPCSTTPVRCSAHGSAAAASPTTPTRSAPTGTSSSTRCRT